LKQQTVGYSQSQQLFSFGLHKGPESFSPLVDPVTLSKIACSKSAHMSAVVAMETADGSQQH